VECRGEVGTRSIRIDHQPIVYLDR
jgi:hypothetical protein